MRKFLDKIIPFCFLLPYIEVNFVREIFEYSDGNANMPASMLFIFIVGILFWIAMPRKNIIYFKKVTIIAIVYHAYLFFGLLVAIMKTSFSVKVLVFQYLWYVIPFWYALIIINYILKRQLDVKDIIKNGIVCFSFYLLFCVMINVKNYGFYIDISGANTQRMISTGGGPVILGYTIALVLALILSQRPFQKRRDEVLIVLILVISALFTGSRGGIWPALVLLIWILITKQNNKINIMMLLFFIFIFIVLNPMELIESLFPRIANMSENGRITTVISGLSVFSKMNIIKGFFGTGLGNLFPYQKFCNFHILGENTFYVLGVEMLVQPHNTYLYLLLETGIIGLIFYCVLLKNIFLLGHKKYKNAQSILSHKMVQYMFVVLGLVEATVLIQPGTAGLWWIILFISCVANRESDSNT